MTEDTKKKNTIRTITVVTLIALTLGLFGGWAIAAATTAKSDEGDVWVVQSQTASVSTEAVELDNVGGSVLQVSVEDGQEVNAVSVSQLVQDWDSEFGDTMPRAVITGVLGGKNHSLIVNLGKPTATATSITFEGSTIVGGGLAQTDFTAVTLLIDNKGLVEAKLKESQAN
ncbi:hypothetical protein [Demequina aurantiaca]|uniref:hypothetical protein n=1 Tax=Demequina aurantiaca TaxID=676200 RepID=UPI0007817566|nr:hypothetical protein [Demequina aurantiaca]